MKTKINEKYSQLCNSYKLQPKSQILKYFSSVSINEVQNKGQIQFKNENDDEINLIFPGNTPENYNNRLTLDDLHPLISSLITFGNNVRVIDLSYNNLGPKSGIYLEKLFDYTVNVKEIILKGNSLDDIACYTMIKPLFDKNESLEILNLNTNCIGNLGLMEIAKVILKKPSLQKLDIGHNYYDWDGLIAINYALKPSIKKSSIKIDNRNDLIGIIEKNISNSPIKQRIDEKSELKYSYFPNLKSLNLDDPQYTDNDQDFFTHFGKMLLINESLERLSLRYHKIRFDGCKILFHHLDQNSTLQVLDISNNQICFQGISYISQYLTDKSYKKDRKKFPNLLSLNLSGNHIHNQGAFILSDGISKNCSLMYLDISNNNIKNDGLFKLAEGLFENKTIQFLKIFIGNQWGKTSISVYKDLVEVKENFNPDFEIYETFRNELEICYKDDQFDEEINLRID